jgi:excinuclease ABC subunit A
VSTAPRPYLGEKVGTFDTITGAEAIDDVVGIDQSPIGKSPRLEPVTYVKAFDEIRRIFADAPARPRAPLHAGDASASTSPAAAARRARAPAISRSRWSSWPTCSCRATNAAASASSLPCSTSRVNGKNIYDVLELTVDEAIRFFPREEKLGQALWQLQQVGLGYLRLGQPATTLSGGEAQRLKVARELALGNKKSGKKLYIMDEPTTGLHLDDIRKLAQVFDRLVDAGHTLVLIEHNMDVIKLADWVIDLGPEAGERGGEVVGSGRPEEIARWRARTPVSGCATSCPASRNSTPGGPGRPRPTRCRKRFKSLPRLGFERTLAVDFATVGA